MNVEELKKLKSDLESKKMYLPISKLYERNNVIGLPMSPEDIIKQENTEDVVKQVEKLIEKAVLILTVKGIPFDQLKISSEFGFFCIPNYLYQFKKMSYTDYLESDIDSDSLTAFYQKLKTQVFPNIVPVNFSLNYALTGLSNGKSIDEFVDGLGLKANEEFNIGNVSGFVDWEKFVIRMNELGYNIEFLNYENGVSFQDYIQAVINEGDDTEIDVSVDFGISKKMGM